MSDLAALDRALAATAAAYVVVNRSAAGELVARLRDLTAQIEFAQRDLARRIDRDRDDPRVGTEVVCERPAFPLVQASDRLVRVWMSRNATSGLHEAERRLRDVLAMFFIDRSDAACAALGMIRPQEDRAG